jgi:signal transduction histidine kinase
MEIDLSHFWKQCQIDLPSSSIPSFKVTENCNWNEVVVASPKLTLRHSSQSWQFLKTNFKFPNFCKDPRTSCALIIGRTRVPIQVFLNGISIGNHIKFQSNVSYPGFLPVTFDLPPDLLSPKNEVIILAAPSPGNQFNLFDLPIKIAQKDVAIRAILSGLGQSVLLPSACGLGALTLLIITIIGYLLGADKDSLRLFRLFGAHCLSTTFVFVSLSRIFRLILPMKVTYPLHFVILLAYLASLLKLIQYITGSLPAVCKLIQVSLIPVAGLLLILCGTGFFDHSNSAYGEFFFLSYILGVVTHLFSTGIAFSVFLGFALKGRPRIQNQDTLFAMFSFLAFANTWDLLAILSQLPEIYLLRWYPYMTAIIFSVVILKKYYEHINKLELESKIGVFARQVAHDIRSPLAALKTATSLVYESPEEKNKLLEQTSRRIGEIADTLLSRPHSLLEGSIFSSKNYRNTHINEAILGLVEEKKIQYHRLNKIQIVFQPNIQIGLIDIGCSTIDLARIISNLIDNAVQAIHEKGIVKIKLNKFKGAISIDICDNGKGIPSHLLPRLGQMGETHNKVNGFGMGLYHAKQVLGSSGGELTIKSQVNQGTTVSIRLPYNERSSHCVFLN